MGVCDIPAWRALSWRRPAAAGNRPGQEDSRIATPGVMALENAENGCFSENN
jgi:hypothetical protein